MKRFLFSSILAVALILVTTGSALAAFGLNEADVKFSEEGGGPTILAGSHPFEMSTRISFNRIAKPGGIEAPDEQVKDLITVLPTGFVGNPEAADKCTAADFADISLTTELPNCSDDAVVGLVNVEGLLQEGKPEEIGALAYVPVYNLEPAPGKVAKFGFSYLQVPVTIDAELEEHSPQEKKPYKIVASLTNTSQVLQLYGAELILWGNPASSVHDPFRGTCLDLEKSSGEPVSKGNCPVTGEDLPPFLTMPRSCSGPLQTDFSADSWLHRGQFVSKSSLTDEVIGCSELDFEPEVSLAPDASAGDSPTGISFDLVIDDEGLVSSEPGARAQSDIKKVVATLPPGVVVNPSLAGGLEACTSVQIAQETASSPFGAGCPSASRIGSVEVETPLLPNTLTGSVFAAKQLDNPFGSLLALYVVIKNAELGVSVSLAGKVEPDPKTGQIVSVFDELPQIPFSHFELRFREGPRAPLITPGLCGDYETKTELTPWANPSETVIQTSTFKVSSGPDGSPCTPTQPFGPSFDAGTANPVAGSYSPFTIRLRRDDGTQRLTGVDMTLPRGLVGRLAGVPYCPDDVLATIASMNQPGQGASEIANPLCPSASRIGTVTVGAGAGSSPVYVSTGRAYLAGPYKGAPLSVAIVTPAVTGPFDLGNIVVRAALYVDTATAEVRTVSDPIPTIVHGIPLDVRDVQISLDRSNFILNPTSCEEMAFTGTAFSELGASSALSKRFQVGSCKNLSFKPKLRLTFEGKMKRTGHPKITAVLTQKPGGANIRRTVVALPATQFVDPEHLGNPCTRAQFAANACPPQSLLGHAEAISPLLDKPLKGPVYFRANGGEYPLPDVVADLRGQIRVILVGHVDSIHRKGSEKSRLRTTFDPVPDAPVTKFVLRLFGGKRGLLVNSQNLCAAPRRVMIKMTAHNNKVSDSEPLINLPSCRKGGKRGK